MDVVVDDRVARSPGPPLGGGPGREVGLGHRASPLTAVFSARRGRVSTTTWASGPSCSTATSKVSATYGPGCGRTDAVRGPPPTPHRSARAAPPVPGRTGPSRGRTPTRATGRRRAPSPRRRRTHRVATTAPTDVSGPGRAARRGAGSGCSARRTGRRPGTPRWSGARARRSVVHREGSPRPSPPRSACLDGREPASRAGRKSFACCASTGLMRRGPPPPRLLRVDVSACWGGPPQRQLARQHRPEPARHPA